MNPAIASEDVYTWVDAQGNVHFSDEPQRGAQRRSPPAAHPASEAASSAPATGGEPPRYSGARPSYRLALEDVRFEPAGSLGSCNGRPVERSQLPQQAAGLLVIGFNERLGWLGFRTSPDAGAGAGSSAAAAGGADVVAIADIASLSLADCGWQASMTVHWRFFDALLREPVLDLVTEARSTHSPNSRNRKRSSVQPPLRELFITASSELARQPEFHRLLDPDGRILASSRPAAAKGASGHAADAANPSGELALSLHYGQPPGSFVDRVEALKAASATVRIAGGHGSGFLISDEGHVITNHHVIDGASRILVLLGDRKIFARVVRSDAKRDVALLQLASIPDAPPLRIARTQPTLGQRLFVMGTPLDERLHHTVTRGVVSAIRNENGLSFIQTDAGVKPGNSGGPVFDEHGDVVAISVAGMMTGTGASLDLNLLIPVDDALRALRVRGRGPLP